MEERGDEVDADDTSLLDLPSKNCASLRTGEMSVPRRAWRTVLDDSVSELREVGVALGSVETRECLDSGELGRGSSSLTGTRKGCVLLSVSLALEELDARKLGGRLGAYSEYRSLVVSVPANEPRLRSDPSVMWLRAVRVNMMGSSRLVCSWERICSSMTDEVSSEASKSESRVDSTSSSS